MTAETAVCVSPSVECSPTCWFYWFSSCWQPHIPFQSGSPVHLLANKPANHSAAALQHFVSKHGEAELLKVKLSIKTGMRLWTQHQLLDLSIWAGILTHNHLKVLRRLVPKRGRNPVSRISLGLNTSLMPEVRVDLMNRLSVVCCVRCSVHWQADSCKPLCSDVVVFYRGVAESL